MREGEKNNEGRGGRGREGGGKERGRGVEIGVEVGSWRKERRGQKSRMDVNGLITTGTKQTSRRA